MKKILVIEDEQDIAKVLSKRLHTAGYEVVISHDVVAGVKEAHREKPDLIILDLMLPGGGGLSALERFKLSTHTANIPVLILTGMQDEAYKKRVMDVGVEAYVEKPYEIENLLSTISRILPG